MPRYFFHLAFGGRLVPDEEGVELPDRSAARGEAMAVIRDLSDRRTGANPRRWAGWFLQLADEQGQFFRTPVGHPALQVVGSDPPGEIHRLEPPTSATVSVPPGGFAHTHVAALVRELSARREHAAQLLEHSRRLQRELSSLCAANESNPRTGPRARGLCAAGDSGSIRYRTFPHGECACAVVCGAARLARWRSMCPQAGLYRRRRYFSVKGSERGLPASRRHFARAW